MLMEKVLSVVIILLIAVAFVASYALYRAICNIVFMDPLGPDEKVRTKEDALAITKGKNNRTVKNK